MSKFASVAVWYVKPACPITEIVAGVSFVFYRKSSLIRQTAGLLGN